MTRRYVITAGELGIYLGFDSFGRTYFTMLDSAGMPAAPAFSKASVAHQHVRTWGRLPPRYDVVPIECAGDYAMLWELDRAGLGHLLGNAYAAFLMRVDVQGMC